MYANEVIKEIPNYAQFSNYFDAILKVAFAKCHLMKICSMCVINTSPLRILELKRREPNRVCAIKDAHI